MNERQMVVAHKHGLSFEYRTVNDLIEELISIKNTHGKDTEIKYGYLYAYDDTEHYYYEEKRPETDDEMNTRIQLMKKKEEDHKNRELKLLENLKLKYKDVS
jgi:rubrerythrin